LPGDVARALTDACPPVSLLAPPVDPSGSIVAVAFSGGLDSTVLLHATVRALGPSRVLAVHVDHRLQSASQAWAVHCARAAARLGARSVVRTLTHAPRRGDSMEAWAREARYAALAQVCVAHGVSLALTAHHADDQAETLLLRLARGSGPDGLVGIASVRDEGPLRLLRPFLSRRRAELLAWAQAAGIAWLEDPSNADHRFPRNALRAEVLPALERAVPGAVASIARAATLARAARDMLAEVAAVDLAAVCTPGNVADVEIDRARLLRLAPVRRAWVLRHWLMACGNRPPSAARLDALQRQLIDARAPSGVLDLDDRLVLRHRDRLLTVDGAQALRVWLARLAEVPASPFVPILDASDAAPALPVQQVPSPDGIGAWSIEPLRAGEPVDPAWTLPARSLLGPAVRFELGTRTGLVLRISPRGPSRSLKNLYQEHGIPAGLRLLFPVLARGDRVLCSAAFGVDRPLELSEGKGWADAADRAGPMLRLRWLPGDEPPAAVRLRALFSPRCSV
jgi:tRNA(Ile)-lysidine synthase